MGHLYVLHLDTAKKNGSRFTMGGLLGASLIQMNNKKMTQSKANGCSKANRTDKVTESIRSKSWQRLAPYAGVDTALPLLLVSETKED